jgi:putative transposase
MPDHVHFMVRMLRGDLSTQMKSFSQFTARNIHMILGSSGPFWQEGFHDHALRDEDSMIRHLQYILENPVRAGLVRNPEEWPYSQMRPKW